MLRCGQHQHDVLARHEAANAVDDRDTVQRPARDRLVDMTPDLFLGHIRVMFQRQRGDVRAVLVGSADAGEAHDGPDVGAALGQERDFAGDIEIVLLDTDGDRAGDREAMV